MLVVRKGRVPATVQPEARPGLKRDEAKTSGARSGAFNRVCLYLLMEFWVNIRVNIRVNISVNISVNIRVNIRVNNSLWR